MGTYYMVVNADKYEVLDMCFAGANIKRGGYLCPSIQHAVLSMLLGMAWNTSAPKEFVGRWACDRIQIQNDGTDYKGEWDTDDWTESVDVGVLWVEHLERHGLLEKWLQEVTGYGYLLPSAGKIREDLKLKGEMESSGR